MLFSHAPAFVFWLRWCLRQGCEAPQSGWALDPASPSAVLLTGGMRAIPDSHKGAVFSISVFWQLKYWGGRDFWTFSDALSQYLQGVEGRILMQGDAEMQSGQIFSVFQLCEEWNTEIKVVNVWIMAWRQRRSTCLVVLYAYLRVNRLYAQIQSIGNAEKVKCLCQMKTKRGLLWEIRHREYEF